MAYASLALAAGAYLLHTKNQGSIRNEVDRSCWINDYLKDRNRSGVFVAIMKEIQIKPDILKQFIRMSHDNFCKIVEMVDPIIGKKDTVFRKAITTAERVMITLRFLATGDSFKSLEFLFKVSDSAIQKIVPETCDAIYNMLKEDHLKVIFIYFFYLF